MFQTVHFSAALIACFTVQTQAADLRLSVVWAGPAQGQYLISVFDGPETWMKTPVASQTLKAATDGASQSVFTLSSGTYAIALVHDANGNGKLDTNAFGIPTEAFGFSNDARARFGPPPFGKAAFKVSGAGGNLTISLNHAKR